MSETANNILKEVCSLSLKDELEKLTKLNLNSISYQSLSDGETNQLAIKIGLLPLEYRNILFFRYCFNNTPAEIDKVFEIENTLGKLPYIQRMLSSFMRFESSWIDESSMKKACEIALVEELKDYENTQILHKPNYSNSFKRKLKNIKIKQNPNNIFLLIVKRVAISLLIFFLSFSAILVVNIEAREKVFDWIIEMFPEFSIFIPKDLDEDSGLVELTSFKINYIPDGFELMNINEGHKMIIYNYISENNQEFYIKILASSGEDKSYYDTEGSKIDEVNVKGIQAYTWETDKMTYLIWYIDGIEYHIVGNLNRDDILKVAENISK